MARPYLGGSSGGIKTLASSQTLQIADSGKTFICSQAGAYDVTLPAASSAKGWEGLFILGTEGSSDFDIVSDPADSIVGFMGAENSQGLGDVSNPADKVTFVGSTAAKGDRIHIICDGSNWYVAAHALDDGHITAAG